MQKFKTTNGVHVMQGSAAYDFLESGNPDDVKKANRLMSYCSKAENCQYKLEIIQKLRKEYNDVL